MALRIGGSIVKDRNTQEAILAVAATASAQARVPTVSGGSGGGAAWTDTITHGDQLTINHVGPWALQGVAKGSEVMQTASLPSGKGYWGISDDKAVWAPTGTFVWNQSTSNHGGVVGAGGITLTGIKNYDGTDVVLPAGTVVAMFRDFSASDFSAQGQGGSYAFIGCRFRGDGIGQPSQFNDFTSTYTNRLFFCDMGSPSEDISDWQGAFWKQIGGTAGSTAGKGSGISRTYCSLQYVTFQPNVDNAFFHENFVEKLVFWGGESGPPGQEGDPLHMACLGCEGGRSGFRFERNRIIPLSPDVDGNVFTNGATIAMEGTGGGAYSDCTVKDNLIGGLNFVILDFGEDSGQTNLVVTGNKVTTISWTNGGRSGVEQAGTSPPPWGSSGNVKSNNTWYDDYGTGGDGNTPTSSRQYPAGNGPRVGTSAF